MERNKINGKGKSRLNIRRSSKIYSNRFKLDVGDEEITLMLGIDSPTTNEIEVTTKVYLTLPSLLRLYDEVDDAVTKLYPRKKKS